METEKGASAPPAAGTPPAGSPPPAGTPPAGSPPPAGTPPAGGNPPPASTWRDTLAPEFKDLPAIKDYPDVNALVKSHVNLQSKLGANPIVMPKENATPEEMNAFFKALGRPDKPTDYKMPEFGKDVTQDPKFMDHFKQTFHAAGMTQKQVEAVSKNYVEYATKAAEAQKAEIDRVRADGIKKLQEEWGDKYEGNVEEAKALIRNHGSEEMLQWLEDTGHGNDQAFLRAFHKMALKVREDRADGAGSNGLIPGQKEAEAERTQLIGDKEFQDALQKADHPKHAEAVQRWQGVHQRILGKNNALVKAM